MILQKETKQSKDIELNLPLFYKDTKSSGKRLVGVLNEQTTIQLAVWDDYISISSSDPTNVETSRDAIFTAIEEWESISEEDFMTEYSNTLSRLSLNPKLTDSPA